MGKKSIFKVTSNSLFLIDLNEPILNEYITNSCYEHKEIKKSSHLILRELLSLSLNISIAEILIEKNSYGKPYLKTVGNMWFNISHSGSTLALLLSRTGEVGIDIEFMSPKKNYTKIANRFFHNKEQLSLKNLSSYAAEHRSHMLWCLKESYIKAIGKGLSQPLNSFYFEIETGHVNLYEPYEHNVTQKWYCNYTKLNHNLGLSVCIPLRGTLECFCLNKNNRFEIL